MNIEMARSGRVRALKMMNSDRLLVRAARSGDDVVMPRKGTIDAHILTELHHGVHVKQLMNETGWSAPKVMEQVFKSAKKARLGVKRQNGVLHLVHPGDTSNTAPESKQNNCENLRVVCGVMSSNFGERRVPTSNTETLPPLLLV